MTRVHDMGGRWGDGAVNPDDNATFAEDWHARAMALTLAAGALGAWNIDTSRHARECLSPRDYARFSYYEKWLAALADLAVAKGLVSEAELRAGHAEAPAVATEKVLRPEGVAGALAAGSPYERDAAAPVFAVGDRVRSRRPAHNATRPGGHTRLPAYAAGAEGEVVRVHGAHVLPDSNAHGLGEAAEPLYAVRFDARALWGAEAAMGDEVVIDMWQSYLEPA